MRGRSLNLVNPSACAMDELNEENFHEENFHKNKKNINSRTLYLLISPIMVYLNIYSLSV